MTSPYDLIIIGTGAGGGTLAAKLAPTGLRILVLERGGYLPREKENWNSEEVFQKGRYKADETWYRRDGEAFHPDIHYFVGGNTKVYGAALLRLRERDFGELQFHEGTSPAWPIAYADLERYYGEAETLYKVHGQHGIDPTEPPTTRPYALPPLPHEPRIQQLYDDLRALGVQAFPLPIGVDLGDPRAGEAPLVLDRFDGFPDPTGSKGDSHFNGIDPAIEHPNVTLLLHRYVRELRTNADGTRIEEVIVAHGDRTETYRAETVVVCAGAINSALLFLRSRSARYPNGLANDNDLVGRHYMAHNNSAMLAISTTPNPTKFGKTFGINDYYFGEADYPYPMGHIQMLGKSDHTMYEEEAPFFTPQFTLEYLADHSLDFWLTTEDLPLPDNRVYYNDAGEVQLDYTPTNVEEHERLMDKLKELLNRLGEDGSKLFPSNLYLDKRLDVAATGHQVGTMRFGTDPATSVLDTNCKVHGLANCYVVDGGFFPSSTSVNPSLTIMAMALRVGELLAAKHGVDEASATQTA